ncbi:MAG: 3-phosphoshikimate 1-carboxyvinyltransferase [Clostridia bacterium]|nr:3-phosphoshikimate 1-carboxyvinyltransferase [Clostridia bacterium]
MEIFKIKPTEYNGEIQAPPSKSFAHRILICAYLSGKEITVKNIGESDDAIVTLNALKTLGATVTKIEDGVIVKKGELPSNKVIIDCNESGSSLRFLLPVVSALGVKAEFTGRGKLLQRPIKELVDCLNLHDALIDGYTVSGKLSKGEYLVDGSISSQYVTGLMLALSALEGESEIIVNGTLVSEPYVNITISVLKDFGVEVLKTQRGYKIIGGYNPNKTEFTVEGDWSGVAFPLVAGAVGGDVTVKGLNLNSVQGDIEILKILDSFGASVTQNGDSVTVKKSTLSGVTLDMDNVPDLCQIVSVLGAYACGTTEIYGVERLKIKESDRIQAIIDMLGACSIKAEYNGEKITIYGGKPKGATLSGGKDHRTVMSSAVLAGSADGESAITGAEYYRKSYPEFVKDFRAIGGEIDVEIHG